MPTKLYFRDTLYNINDGNKYTGDLFPFEGIQASPGITGNTNGVLCFDIATDGTRWLVVGDSGATGSAIVYQAWAAYTDSIDGEWKRTTGAFDSNVDALANCYYSARLGLWIISNDTGKIFTSPTAEPNSWTLRFTPATAGLTYKIREYNNIIFVTTSGGSFHSSTDGINWATTTITGVTSNCLDVEYSATQSKYVFCGGSGFIAITTNLTTWTVTNWGVTNQNCWTIRWSSSLNLWVASGTGGRIATSPTALAGTWTARTSGTTNPLVFMEYDGTRFIAVGDLRTVATSTNGTTWTTTSYTTDTGDFWSIRYLNGRFYATTEFTPALVWTTTNASDWQPIATEKSTTVIMAGNPASRYGEYGNRALNLRSLSTSIGGTTATSLVNTIASTVAQSALMGMFASLPLDVDQTVGAGSMSFFCGDTTSNLNSNFVTNALNVYVWRPSTGQVVGYIRDSANASLGGTRTTVAAQVQSTYIATITPTASVNALAGDIIIVEVWARFTQGMATAYTGHLSMTELLTPLPPRKILLPLAQLAGYDLAKISHFRRQ